MMLCDEVYSEYNHPSLLIVHVIWFVIIPYFTLQFSVSLITKDVNFTYSDNLFLLTEVRSLFTFNAITDIFGFKSAILILAIFPIFCVISFPSLLHFKLIKYYSIISCFSLVYILLFIYFGYSITKCIYFTRLYSINYLFYFAEKQGLKILQVHLSYPLSVYFWYI